MILVCAWFGMTNMVAQEVYRVSGKVETLNGETLPGANVKLTNAKQGGKMSGASTDADGTFSIPVAKGTYQLEISFVGYVTYVSSVEVKEDLLICADFVTDPECLDDPSSAITDIFTDRPGASFGESFLGKETSISAGQGIGRIQDSVSDGNTNGRKAIVPLSTMTEAEKLCTEYLRQRSDSIKQLKLGDPEVRRIIYIPCRVDGDRIVMPDDFGSLVPRHIERKKASSLLTI